MNKQLIIVDCIKEENKKLNDDMDIWTELQEMFEQESDLQNVEIYLLEDDYADYLKKRNIHDNPVSRREYITFNKYRDYDQQFINSTFSDIIDSAIMPVAINNENLVNKNFEILLTSEQRKRLCDYLAVALNGNAVADPVFGGTSVKNIYVNNYILSLAPEIFDHEADLIEEILENKNYGITNKYKRLVFDENAIFTMGFIYVIAINKIPRVVKRSMVKPLNEAIEGIINYRVDCEDVYEIIKTNEYDTCPLCNCLIYPDEIDDVIDGWASAVTKQLDALNKAESLMSSHTKKGKKK